MSYSISKNEYQIIQFFQDKAGFQKIEKCAELLGLTPSALSTIAFQNEKQTNSSIRRSKK